MVYRATIVVKIVCTNELWIRGMNVVNMRCQAGIADTDGLIAWPSVADRRRVLPPHGGRDRRWPAWSGHVGP